MTYTEFIKEKKRLTQNCKINCSACRLSSDNNGISECCTDFLAKCPEEAEAIIEQWAKDCPPKPIKTRQSEFLKMFPDAKVLNGIIQILPCYFLDYNNTNSCKATCDICRKEFWLAPIEEEE